jgi:hypothetical protein
MTIKFDYINGNEEKLAENPEISFFKLTDKIRIIADTPCI